MSNSPRILRKWAACQAGMAAVEFALTIPLLMALFFGGVEMTRYVLIQQKATKTANALADLVAQAETLSTTDMDLLLDATSHLMRPYALTETNSTIIISSVTKTGTAAPVVNWQYPNPATYLHSSQVGVAGSTANLPAGFTMKDKDNIIIAEVYYNYQPLMLQDVVGADTVYKTAFFRPRLGSLSTLN